MKILVYPHTMEVGGSQLNAIELAGAVSDRGHDVMVLGEEGPLVDAVRDRDLEFVLLNPEVHRRPSRHAIDQLVRLVRERRLDVVHGYEWPPGVEAFVGPRLVARTAAVCTVMSMAIAPFLPRNLPLVVGTEELRAAAARSGRPSVTLLEPPVDVRANSPDISSDGFRARYGLHPEIPLAVMVCRLVPELKLEGLLAACDAVARLHASGVALQLAIVGDGSAGPSVAQAAAEANAVVGQRAVVLTGMLVDPRPAYAAADVILGMGGSALRGLAFGKPLVVQGERGYWELLTPATLPTFLRQGWYGVGMEADGRAAGTRRLSAILTPLLADERRRAELGSHGRRIVLDRFSLQAAAEVQEGVYVGAQQNNAATPRAALGADALQATAGLTMYKIRRKWERWRHTVRSDDFNAIGPHRSVAT